MTLLRPPDGQQAVTNRKPVENLLLAALPRAVSQHLLGGLEPVKLSFGEVLYEPGEPIRHIYFPADSLVSLLTRVDRRLALEVGLVGREGMVGTPLATCATRTNGESF